MVERILLVFTVPVADADRVRQALGDAGAGQIGDYSHSSFSIKGTGRFKPTKGANPTIGKVGQLEEVVEERVEIMCDKEQIKELVTVLKKVHPYEEPAIYIHPLLSAE